MFEHTERPAGERYWACERSEAPPTALTAYDEGCPKCMIKARADVQHLNLGSYVGEHHTDKSGTGQEMTLSDFVEQYG